MLRRERGWRIVRFDELAIAASNYRAFAINFSKRASRQRGVLSLEVKVTAMDHAGYVLPQLRCITFQVMSVAAAQGYTTKYSQVKRCILRTIFIRVEGIMRGEENERLRHPAGPLMERKALTSGVVDAATPWTFRSLACQVVTTRVLDHFTPSLGSEVQRR
jgi:hypothetical protein